MIAISPPPPIEQRLRVRALLVGDRLNAAGLEVREMISTTPAAFRIQSDGLAVLFHYGVVVLIGLKTDEKAAFLVALKPRIISEFARYEEETPKSNCATMRGIAFDPAAPSASTHFPMTDC